MRRVVRVVLVTLFVCCLSPAPVLAQLSYITGTVTDAGNSRPISGVRVHLRNAAGATVDSASTNELGQFRIANVAAGSYSLAFAMIGFRQLVVPDVSVGDGLPVIQGVELTPAPFQLGEQIISTSSRSDEAMIRTAASVSMIPARTITERPSLTLADHVAQVPGLHVSRGGLQQSNIVARGFNNAFSGTLLTLVDQRFASVPSLRVNVPSLFSITDDDIDRVEVVLGPAGALYGPNSANGVLAVFTRSPFDSPRTSLSLEVGERSTVRGAIRKAIVFNPKLALKISAEKLTGRDFRYTDPEEPSSVLRPPSAGEQRVPTASQRDFSVGRAAGELRVDYRPDSTTQIIGSYGLATLGSGLEITGSNGAAQGRHWVFSNAQLRVSHKGFFGQFFANFSNAGNEDSLDTHGTYLLRTGNPIVDRSSVAAVQLQQAWKLNQRQSFTLGADFVQTTPVTDGTINGRNEDDDDITEYGLYAHSLTQLTPRLDLTAALRSDYQSIVDDMSFAPRVGIVYRPTETQAWRLTFNRAQFTPANFSFFLDLQIQQLDPTHPELPFFIRALGNNGGFTYKRDCTQGVEMLCMKTPFSAMPGTFIDAGGTALYNAGLTAAQPTLEPLLTQRLGSPEAAAQVIQYLRSLTPTNEQVGGRLQVAIPGTGLIPFSGTPADIAPLRSESYNVLELGYKTVVRDRGWFAADVWYQRRHNLTGPALNISPSVFVSAEPLASYLTAQLTPVVGAQNAVELATLLSGNLAMVPLGTVVPDHPLASSGDVLFSYYQVLKDVDLFGADLAIDYPVGERWTLAGTYSWASDDFFPEVFGAGVEPLSLNAADNKATLALRFRDDDRGISAELRGRYANTFPVSSGVYQGTVPVNAMLDVAAAYRMGMGGRFLLSLQVTNVLDNKRPTFIGVPAMGRLALSKLQVAF
jgi:iron complex outermembrane receptor protein